MGEVNQSPFDLGEEIEEKEEKLNVLELADAGISYVAVNHAHHIGAIAIGVGSVYTAFAIKNKWPKLNVALGIYDCVLGVALLNKKVKYAETYGKMTWEKAKELAKY